MTKQEVITMLVWPVVTALLNVILYKLGDEKYVESHPRLASTVHVLRASGLDPVALLRAVRVVVSGKQGGGSGGAG